MFGEYSFDYSFVFDDREHLSVYLFNDVPREWLIKISSDMENGFWRSISKDFYYVDATKDEWEKNLYARHHAPHNRVKSAIRDFYLGVKYRFPLCCILNFCLDKLGKKWSGQKRGFKYTRWDVPYVPCIFHTSRYFRITSLV